MQCWRICWNWGPIPRAAIPRWGEWCGKYGVEELICYGPESRYTAEAAEKAGVPVHYVENKEAAAPVLANLVRPDDVVLLKGSHGMEVFSLIDTVFRKGAKTC